MSAPTPANGDHATSHGFYPDPSIPGYVRYWNGSSWVPGTSRPAPAPGEPMPTPPPGAVPAVTPHAGLPNLASVPARAPVSAPAPTPARVEETGPFAPVEETGPFFFDEEERAQEAERARPQHAGGEVEVRHRADPAPAAPAWQADTSRQDGFGGERDRRVSWGSPASPGSPPDAAPPHTPSAASPSAASSSALTPAPPHGRTPPQPRTPAAEPRTADPRTGGSRPGDPGTGDPRTADPRTPGGSDAPPPRGERPALEPPAAQPTGRPGRPRGAASGVSGPVRSPSPVQAPAASPAPTAASAPAPADGTMSIRTIKPAPRTPSAPRTQPPSQEARSAPAPAHHTASAKHPASARTSASAQSSAPARTPVPSPGRTAPPPPASASASASADGPVTPWKPPVEDPFTRAAREQAAARPAGLGRRLAARLIDTLVLGAAVGAVAVPLVAQAVDHIDEKIRAAKLSGTTVTVYLLDSTTVGILAAVLGAFLVLGVLYEAVPTAKWGRTLGKKLLRLQVRDIEEHEPPGFGGAMRRWLVYGVLGILGIGVLNVLWCLFDRPWRQCWHDKAARTFVAGKC
ncbi:RDD family protein [Streptomyces sp. CA-294286]|uniref:RDD family protein n=1 Tax=Streptomyces sp. CA-294286 TaxID=3240070 RepID=UPI003D8F7E3B